MQWEGGRQVFYFEKPELSFEKKWSRNRHINLPLTIYRLRYWDDILSQYLNIPIIISPKRPTMLPSRLCLC